MTELDHRALEGFAFWNIEVLETKDINGVECDKDGKFPETKYNRYRVSLRVPLLESRDEDPAETCAIKPFGKVRIVHKDQVTRKPRFESVVSYTRADSIDEVPEIKEVQRK